MPAATVFISYSHQDEAWKDRLLPQLQALVTAGVAMEVWHDRKIDGGDTWYPEIQRAMDSAAAAIVLISAPFLASPFCIQQEVPALLKRQEDHGMLLIPVLLRQCPWKAHRWLKDRQMIPRDGKTVAIDFAGDLADEVFAAVAEQVLSHFVQLDQRLAATMKIPAPLAHPAAQPRAAAAVNIVPPSPVVQWPALPAECIDLTRLPETGSALFGRDEELALLDRAWESAQQANAAPVRVLVFTAHGGVGKSTLVNHWLAEMARDHHRGATHVFGWSFFSQGVRDVAATSADAFIDAALRFFGDPDASAGSPWDKGERLARLAGSRRALLVLDGLEPLQSAHSFERGKLRDPALESLLRGLARQSAGLCLVTTRENVTDLAGRPGVTLRDLEQIDVQAGRALLRTARVLGTDAELETLASGFGPHALAVSLLGVYLREQPGHGIGPAEALAELPGNKPIDRVLAGFEQWLGDSAEHEALRLLGFFDRPADAGCLRALRRPPAIPGLTDRLAGVDDAEWERVLARLAKLRLVHLLAGRSGGDAVDAHPLVREHFADLLKDGPAWRDGHRRLYEHLCASTQDQARPTLEDLQPLYQAVAHGCQAGMQQEACDAVYYARIKRRDENYSSKKLGAFGSDLGAVACFFERPWSHLSLALTAPDQAWLLNEAAFRLRALGRLAAAIEPMRAALQMRIAQKELKHAGACAGNLSELELTLGEVSTALRDAKQSVTYADRSGDGFQRMANRTTHADALHQAGQRSEAEGRFREAEAMQIKDQPDYPLLYSLQGFRYCDLLLADGERVAWQCVLGGADCKSDGSGVGQQGPTHAPGRTARQLRSCGAVSDRAAKMFEWRVPSDSLLDIALDHLTLGRAALYTAILEGSSLNPCHSSIQHAVDGLRRAGSQDHLPRGLLTRAWLRSLAAARTGPDSAQHDLDEAWEIAERGPMRLFLADIHLHRARLFGASPENYPWQSPAADLAAARRLIEKHGYLRRTEELEDAENALLRKPESDSP